MGSRSNKTTKKKATTVKASSKVAAATTIRTNGGKEAKYIGARVAKYFRGRQGHNKKVYYGTIDKIFDEEGLFHVKYDDGDGEDLNAYELSHALDLYNKRKRRPKQNKKNKVVINARYYKITWQFSKGLSEFGQYAFEDCYVRNGTERDDADEEYRSREEEEGPTDLPDVYKTVKKANKAAYAHHGT